MTESNTIAWEALLSTLVIFAFLALIIERALYQIFDSKLWKKFEETINQQTGSDFLDLKPWISVAVSIWVVIQLKLDMIAQIYQKAEPSLSTMILTGLFIAGGSTGIYKFFKRARKLKETINQEEIDKHAKAVVTEK
jgi:hypothetical protein